MNVIRELLWKLLEKVIDGRLTKDRARYILAGSGYLDEFDESLEILMEEKK